MPTLAEKPRLEEIITSKRIDLYKIIANLNSTNQERALEVGNGFLKRIQDAFTYVEQASLPEVIKAFGEKHTQAIGKGNYMFNSKTEEALQNFITGVADEFQKLALENKKKIEIDTSVNKNQIENTLKTKSDVEASSEKLKLALQEASAKDKVKHNEIDRLIKEALQLKAKLETALKDVRRDDDKYGRYESNIRDIKRDLNATQIALTTHRSELEQSITSLKKAIDAKPVPVLLEAHTLNLKHKEEQVAKIGKAIIDSTPENSTEKASSPAEKGSARQTLEIFNVIKTIISSPIRVFHLIKESLSIQKESKKEFAANGSGLYSTARTLSASSFLPPDLSHDRESPQYN